MLTSERELVVPDRARRFQRLKFCGLICFSVLQLEQKSSLQAFNCAMPMFIIFLLQAQSGLCVMPPLDSFKSLFRCLHHAWQKPKSTVTMKPSRFPFWLCQRDANTLTIRYSSSKALQPILSTWRFCHCLVKRPVTRAGLLLLAQATSQPSSYEWEGDEVGTLCLNLKLLTPNP